MKKIFFSTLILFSMFFILSCDNPTSSESIEEHQHSFTEQKVDDEHLQNKATCTNPAKYYYSCSCGEKSTETFEYGEN